MKIVYNPYIIINLTGNTSDFYNNSGITSGMSIYSGFTLNIDEFDNKVIHKIDIIENLINYVKCVDIYINKYMTEVTIVGSVLYDKITKPGLYCIKIKLSDSNRNEFVDYFIVYVIYNVSMYSEGYWQDSKVWIDSVLLLDHPI
jgi:hypothetical protein